MRRALIIGGALLFGPAGCGSKPVVGTKCEANQKDCDDATKTAYFCAAGTWTSSTVAAGYPCECYLDPSSGNCPVIGYVGIDRSGAAAARAGVTRLRDRLLNIA